MENFVRTKMSIALKNTLLILSLSYTHTPVDYLPCFKSDVVSCMFVLCCCECAPVFSFALDSHLTKQRCVIFDVIHAIIVLVKYQVYSNIAMTKTQQKENTSTEVNQNKSTDNGRMQIININK